jgi:hypothetical protein
MFSSFCLAAILLTQITAESPGQHVQEQQQPTQHHAEANPSIEKQQPETNQGTEKKKTIRAASVAFSILSENIMPK